MAQVIQFAGGRPIGSMAVMLFGMAPKSEEQSSNRKVRGSRLDRCFRGRGMWGQEPFRNQTAVGLLAGTGAMLAEVVVMAIETDDSLAGRLGQTIGRDATLFGGQGAVP